MEECAYDITNSRPSAGKAVVSYLSMFGTQHGHVFFARFVIFSMLFTPDSRHVVVVLFTLTDRASTIPSNIRGCQSGTWSQRGTKVNGSHHDDNQLLRPTGIQIATKSYATLQAMVPTNNKTVHQTCFTPYREQSASIDSDCCRLPTISVLSNKSDNYVPTSFDQQFQVSQGHTSYKNKEN